MLFFLNFAVDLLLLIATNRLSGYPSLWRRTVTAALLGGVYGSVCILPEWTFLAGTFWRLVFLLLISIIAFGVNKEAVRRSILFIVLSMALGGIALGIGCGGVLSVILSAVAVCAMCIFGLRGRIGRRFLPVEIKYNGKIHRFIALIDTGNCLSDPVTGQQAMVVSSALGRRLLGEGNIQFSDPVTAMQSIRGGRLIPFHTVGSEGGVLAAKCFQDVTIGKWHGPCLVAFSPQNLGGGEAYEALTGGVL